MSLGVSFYCTLSIHYRIKGVHSLNFNNMKKQKSKNPLKMGSAKILAVSVLEDNSKVIFRLKGISESLYINSERLYQMLELILPSQKLYKKQLLALLEVKFLFDPSESKVVKRPHKDDEEKEIRFLNLAGLTLPQTKSLRKALKKLASGVVLWDAAPEETPKKEVPIKGTPKRGRPKKVLKKEDDNDVF